MSISSAMHVEADFILPCLTAYAVEAHLFGPDLKTNGVWRKTCGTLTLIKVKALLSMRVGRRKADLE
jgi:hypothetical protein